jgi:hypothetical protein
LDIAMADAEEYAKYAVKLENAENLRHKHFVT